MRYLLLFWQKLVLRLPYLTLFLVCLITLFFALHVNKFRLDASSESLVLENDPALEFYRKIRERYGSDDFLVVTYTPVSGDSDQVSSDKQSSPNALFSQSTLEHLQRFQADLIGVDGIESALSILNVPLVNTKGPDGLPTLSSVQEQVLTLQTDGVSPLEAKQEFVNSPIYRDLLISADGETTAIQLNLSKVTNTQSKSEQMAQQKRMVNSVREVMALYQNDSNTGLNVQMYLGGIPMITVDSIEFIEHDLIVFGAAVLVFLLLTLIIAFQRPRWVILPLLTCAIATVIMLGLLGFLNWPVTVVSANFICLMLIMTLSFSIHLIVRFQELHAENPNQSQYWLVLETVKKKFLPCLFTALTTMVAFGSLLFSFIRPVIDFGWMMTIGIAVAFILSFTLFPSLLVLLKNTTPSSQKNITGLLTNSLSKLIKLAPKGILGGALVIFVISVVGMSKLTVENRFIDYFKDTTEIYQGMSIIDEKLGGTTPLDVVIDAPASFFENNTQNMDPDPLLLEDLGLTKDEYLAMQSADSQQGGITSTSYWFNVRKLKEVTQIHNYLDQRSDTGKVLSIASTMRMLKPLDADILDDNFYLSLVYKKLPLEIKEAVVSPYMSEDGNQLRFSIRIYESDSELKRNELLAEIKRDLNQQFGLSHEQVQLTGMAVLYNNMLQNLFKSQILTLGVVFVAIFVMFVMIFQHVRLALIALVPNVLAACLVLGIMGLVGISLDLMTITIAAICVGIAVDDSIHYLHRFKLEFAKDGDYEKSVQRSHASIGRAIYYTSITITVGFSILILSNFVPTMYFGMLTGLSMLVALLANLTVLPLLLTVFKPIKKNVL